MATITGPLLSLRARGSLASLLVYTANRGKPVLKTSKRKTNRNTIEQRSHRSMLRYLVQSWIRLIPPARASWVNNVPTDQHSAYHWYLAFNMERWRRGLGPAYWYGLQDSGTTPTMTSWAITQHFGYVRVLWPATGFANVYSAAWHRGSGNDFAVSPQTTIHVDYWPNYRFTQIVDVLPKPGLYEYRLELWNPHGISYVHPDTKSAIYT